MELTELDKAFLLDEDIDTKAELMQEYFEENYKAVKEDEELIDSMYEQPTEAEEKATEEIILNK